MNNYNGSISWKDTNNATNFIDSGGYRSAHCSEFQYVIPLPIINQPISSVSKEDKTMNDDGICVYHFEQQPILKIVKIWIWMWWFFNSLRRSFINNKLSPYVKRIHLVASYWPSRVTNKIGFSCYWKTEIDGLVFSGHILDKGPLRVVHLSIA